MLEFFNPIRDLNTVSVILRMLLAVMVGAVIGLERSAKNRPAGFRTHILVCMGAAVAAMTGLYLFLALKLPTDVSRLAAQVISGLGFIGAGTIVVTKKMSIKGLTTAAGLWVTAAVGMACGVGMYTLAAVSTVIVLLCFEAFNAFLHKMRGKREDEE